MPSVHSFDVFDTVLTRTVGDPRAVLSTWARRVVATIDVEVDAAALAASRHRVERELNAWADAHATLDDIHQELARRLGWPSGIADELAALEQAVERELVVPLPSAPAMLRRARSTGADVVFVSDTPHSEEFITELLAVAGLWTSGDRVFTSSARGASKSRGGLFHAVSEQLGTRDVVHHGDDVHSDVASARWEGWQARWERGARLNRYESTLTAGDVETGGVGSLLAGAGRLARIRAVSEGTDPAVASVTTGAMAPMLIGYVTWCLQRARHLGLERLYFVARDGEVMLRTAEAFSWMAPDVELRYLWGSRQPWVLAASASHPELLRSWVMGRTDFTADTALGRLGVDPGSFFQGTGFEAASPARRHHVMSRDDRDELARLVQGSPWVEAVREASLEVRRRCDGYLGQEGLFDGVPHGLVDAGWSGRASAALDELVRGGGGQPGTHFYVGQLGRAEESGLRDGVRIEPWLFDRQRRPGSLGDLTSPNVLVEMFCAGTTGRTVDYEQGPDGRWGPVLDRPANTEFLEWGIEGVQQLAVDVAHAVADGWRDLPYADLTPVVRRLLEQFWERPTDAEVAAWGHFPGEEEIWPPFMDLAQAVTTRSVLGRVRRRETMLRPNNTWRAGSVAVSRPPWSTVVALRAWQKRHPHALRATVRRQSLRALRVWARRSPRR